METTVDHAVIQFKQDHGFEAQYQTIGTSSNHHKLIHSPLGAILPENNTQTFHLKNLERHWNEMGQFTISDELERYQDKEGHLRVRGFDREPEYLLYNAKSKVPDYPFPDRSDAEVQQVLRTEEILKRRGELSFIYISSPAESGSLSIKNANEGTSYNTMVFVNTRVAPGILKAFQIYIAGERGETPFDLHQKSLTLAALLDPSILAREKPLTPTELISHPLILQDIADSTLKALFLNSDGLLNKEKTIQTILQVMGKPVCSYEQERNDAHKIIEILFEIGAHEEYIDAVLMEKSFQAMERGIRHGDNLYKYLLALYREKRLSIKEIRDIALQVKDIKDYRETTMTVDLDERSNAGKHYDFENSPFEKARKRIEEEEVTKPKLENSVVQPTRNIEIHVPFIPIAVMIPWSSLETKQYGSKGTKPILSPRTQPAPTPPKASPHSSTRRTTTKHYFPALSESNTVPSGLQSQIPNRPKLEKSERRYQPFISYPPKRPITPQPLRIKLSAEHILQKTERRSEHTSRTSKNYAEVNQSNVSTKTQHSAAISQNQKWNSQRSTKTTQAVDTGEKRETTTQRNYKTGTTTSAAIEARRIRTPNQKTTQSRTRASIVNSKQQIRQILGRSAASLNSPPVYRTGVSRTFRDKKQLHADALNNELSRFFTNHQINLIRRLSTNIFVDGALVHVHISPEQIGELLSAGIAAKQVAPETFILKNHYLTTYAN